MLVACWPSFGGVTASWILCDNVYERVCCYNRCHGMVIIALNEFWELSDNIIAVAFQ
jgi:hypothetical protein